MLIKFYYNPIKIQSNDFEICLVTNNIQNLSRIKNKSKTKIPILKNIIIFWL